METEIVKTIDDLGRVERKSHKVFLYGAGYICHKLISALEDLELQGKVCAILVT